MSTAAGQIPVSAASRHRKRVEPLTSSGIAVLIIGSAFGALVVLAPAVVAVLLPSATMVLLLVGLVRWLGQSDTGSNPRIMAWTLGAFALHLAIGLAIWSSSSLTRTLGGDALTYHDGAIGIYQHWTQGGLLPILPSGKTGFFYLLAGLYWLFGIHATAGLVLDAAMGAAVIPLMTDVTRRLFGTEAARPVPALATLLPGFLLWGSQLLREAGVYLLLAACLAAAVRLSEGSTPGRISSFAVSAALLVAWRADVGLTAAVGLALGAALLRGGPSGAVAGAGALGIVAVIVVGVGVGYSGYHLIAHANLSAVNSIRTSSSQGAASGFLPNADVSTAGRAAGYLPLGAVYLLLGPFPWQIHGGRQLLAVPDSLIWWFLLPSLWRGIKGSWAEYGIGSAMTLLPAVIVSGVLSLLVGNFGTTVRERMQVILLVLPLVALGRSRCSLKRGRIHRHGGASNFEPDSTATTNKT